MPFASTLPNAIFGSKKGKHNAAFNSCRTNPPRRGRFSGDDISCHHAGFEDLVARFLAEPGNLAKGPYVTVALPFRKQTGGKKAFEWIVNRLKDNLFIFDL